MDEDKKIFLKYILYEYFSWKKIRKKTFYELAIIFLLFIIVFLFKFSTFLKFIITIIGFLFIIYLNFKKMYSAGWHRHWYREKYTEAPPEKAYHSNIVSLGSEIV